MIRTGIRKSLLLLALGAACMMGGTVQAATRSLLYVANSQGDDITIIDLATQKIVKTMKVGPIVHGVVVIQTTKLSKGTNALTATYGGDGNYLARSAHLTVTVV